MENYSGFVQQALDSLGTMRSQEERTTEENKARLTRLAAYLINQRNPNIGLIKKETGNNVMGMSVDLILDKSNGEFADIASDTDDGGGFRRVIPMFIPNTDPALIARWIQPTAVLAGVETTVVPENHGGEIPPKVDDMSVKFDSMAGRFDAMGGRFEAVDARLSAMEASLQGQAAQLTQILNDMNRALSVIQDMGSMFRR